MSTLPPNACRLRVRYVKDGRLAYLGHLEVMQTVMRSVRRSGVPFEVGNGFARRMRIQFSQALPVGASSRGEYYDLLLSDPLDEQEALEALRLASPKALAPNAAMLLPRRVPALEAWADFSRWKVCVRGLSMDAEEFAARVQELREQDVLRFMRGEKERSISLAQTLVSCEASDVANGIDLVLQTRHSSQGSLRPAVLVNAVCGVAPLRVCRMGQWHLADDGYLIDPMTRGE
ncbi:MAG: TIGR03936 family radical SAM-associated protein [Atopobiaceae bacterium]|nr:TIGR03936 family radical SAM-associated protein [Atopobiaceae bacterium]